VLKRTKIIGHRFKTKPR